MFDYLFDHPGKKIKTYAIVMFALEVVLVCVIFFVLLFLFARSGADAGDFFALFLGGIIALAIVIFFAFVNVLLLYAFGELTEETTRQSELFQENNELLRQLLARMMGRTPRPSPDLGPAPAPGPAPTPTPGPAPTPKPLHPGQTRCSQCGTVQNAHREKCYNCGAPLEGE